VARGGSQAIAEALASLLRAHGGEIQVNSEIRSLGELEGASAVLLDLTPRQVLRIAQGWLPPWYRRQLGAFRYAPGVFKVDWALSGPIPWRAPECHRAGTLHLGASSAEIMASADAAWYGRPDRTPFVLLAQPSLFDPTRCPPERHTAWAYCHVPFASTEDRTEAIERQVERFAPGFRERILARHTFNSRELEAHDANLVGGDINGGVQDVRQMVFRPVPRLDPYATPVRNLFLCSASTPPGGSVHGMCGFHAARSLLSRLGAGRTGRTRSAA
jgi:phytoene dehydrogenase-like protein